VTGPPPDPDERRRWTERGMLLAWWAGRQPTATAVVSPAGRRTFAQLNANANALVRALRSRGLGAGDPVALLCTNRPEFVEAVFACQRGGFRLTPVNWHLTGPEAAYIVDNCEARTVIADASLGASADGSVAGRPPGTVRLAVGGELAGFEPYAGALAAESGEDLDDPQLGSSMLYTSGTTGQPKGVYRAPVASTPLLVNVYGYVEGGDDLHLCTGPLYHAAPLAFSLLAPMAFGIGVVLMDHWTPEECLRLIGAHRITHSHMVPTMFHRLLALPEETRAGFDVSSLRFVVHGAAPCPVTVKRRLIEWLGPVVFEYYGATEGLGTFVDSPGWLARPGTVGRPMTEGLVMVADEVGLPLGPGEIGLVYLRAVGQARFEYFGDPSRTDAAYTGDHFTLGDIGYLDDEGYLFLTDRSSNLIISGGVNIYPAEVDAVILEHPSVADVAVIGVPDEEWGEAVRAVVELACGVEPSDELAGQIIELCQGRLAHYKCPRSVDFVDSLPREDTGKIYKRLLREQYRRGAGTG
jgi:long-chain acyl-CoA synthetase